MGLGWRKRRWRPTLASRKRSQSAGAKATPSEALNPVGESISILTTMLYFIQSMQFHMHAICRT